MSEYMTLFIFTGIAYAIIGQFVGMVTWKIMPWSTKDEIDQTALWWFLWVFMCPVLWWLDNLTKEK